MLHQQQAQNQELQKNMLALASQMKGLEEEAIKKLRIKEPYSMLPPPTVAPRTISNSSSVEASATTCSSETGEKVVSKSEGGEGKIAKEKVGVDEGSADVGSVGAVKHDANMKYGKSNHTHTN